jgi:hypothetical protein
MANVIDRLPFSSVETAVAVPGGTVRILPFQIVLLVSITPKGRRNLPADAPRFPAVLDTAFNREFLLQEQHLLEWAELVPDGLVPVDELVAYRRPIPILAANVWLHRNRPGRTQGAPRRHPVCIHIDPGIAVCPSGVGQPRLPLLGIRALFLANLQLLVDWDGQGDDAGYVSLRSPRRQTA